MDWKIIGIAALILIAGVCAALIIWMSGRKKRKPVSAENQSAAPDGWGVAQEEKRVEEEATYAPEEWRSGGYVEDDEQTVNPYSAAYTDDDERTAAPEEWRSGEYVEDDERTVNPYGAAYADDEERTVAPEEWRSGGYVADDERTVNPYGAAYADDDERTVAPHSWRSGGYVEDDERTVNPYGAAYAADDEKTVNPYGAYANASFDDDEETVNPYAMNWMPQMVVNLVMEEEGRRQNRQIVFTGSMWIGGSEKCELRLQSPESENCCAELTYGGGNLYARSILQHGGEIYLDGEKLGHDLTPLRKGSVIEICHVRITIESVSSQVFAG